MTDALPRDADIVTLQARMQAGTLRAESLTRSFLARIEAIDRDGPTLNSIIEVNPEALDIARALDRERAESGPRGPLHGIPVMLKANIDTADRMETTAGSLALAGHHPPRDAFVVSLLRDAGAVILGKTNLSEWANFRSTRSTGGWSSIGGQTNNAYDPARNPCGSSSGSAVAVAADLTTVAVGTETNGSIVCPASVNGIVGIKPTLGLVSRSGIIPIAHSYDTAGPMARTVRDAATLLTAMVARDADDPLAERFPSVVDDFAADLTPDALVGARIGVFRGYRGAGDDARVEAILSEAIATLGSLGAEIVDPGTMGTDSMGTDGMDAAALEVLYFEFKADLEEYLVASGAPLRALAEVIAFNDAHADTVMPRFGQEHMVIAESKGPLSDPTYLQALADSKRIAQTAIDDALSKHELTALIAPTRGPAWPTDPINGDLRSGISSSSLAAISGYPSISLPAGDIDGLPVGLSFIGGAFDDRTLIRYAHAFEHAGYQRTPPPWA